MYPALKKMLVIRLGIMVVVLAVAIIASLQWLQPMVDQALSQNEVKEAEYATAKLADQNLAKLEKDFQATEQSRAVLFDYLLPQSQVFRVIDQLEKIGRQNNLAYKIDVQNNLVALGRAQMVPAAINLRGDKNDIARFLSALERLRYPVVEQKFDYETKYLTAVSGEVREGVNATVTVLIGIAPEKY